MEIISQRIKPGISRVHRSKEEAKKSYDRISRFYDYTEGLFEKRYINIALGKLAIKPGEIVLEIGFGTGYALSIISEKTGREGKVCGIDISPKMMDLARTKLKKKKVSDRVELICQDALKLPYPDNKFDAIFMSFTLELFDTPEIPLILKEIKRVLKPGGRLVVASTSKENGRSIYLNIYEWAHRKFPKYIDCRPIYVLESMKNAGFTIKYNKRIKIYLIPDEIVIGIK